MTATPATKQDVTELVEAVERAKALFDAGDVEKALKLSAVTYDQAKAAAASAARVKASRELVEKARRMQADALKIESLCYVAMADAVDEAQAKGQIARPGRKPNVQDADIFTLDDVGIDRRRLSEARKIRDQVRAEPDFVDRVVEARLAEGLEPSRAALKKAAGHAVGTKTATKEERGDDLYQTPIEAVRTLLALESFSATVWEPSVGKGAIMRPLEEAGYDVEISDVVDRGVSTRHGVLQTVGDVLKWTGPAGDEPLLDIVTNPPYGIANAYIAHALKAFRPRKMAMLLNLNFLAGFEDADRCFVMDEAPPSRIYVFTRRLPMMHRDGWTGKEASSQMNTGWFVWERNEDGFYGQGYPQIIRVDWKVFETAAALPPGAGGNISPLAFASPDPEFERQTPRKDLDQRVEEEFERAMAFIASLEPFGLRRFCSNVGVRTSVGEALIEALLFNSLIEPAGNGEWRISVKGISTSIDVAAAVAVREWRAARTGEARHASA